MQWIRNTTPVSILVAGNKRAILTGIGLFGVGFGAMNLFWWTGSWRRGVPGLWDYRSATIGDGLLLPIAAGILVAGVDSLPPCPYEIRASTIAGAIGALVAIGITWTSLRDPSPALNWTLPQPHKLNIAGWYHAALLVVVSTFFASWTTRLLWRVRSDRYLSGMEAKSLLHRPSATVLIACLLSFVGLVIRDMYSIRTSSEGLVMIVAVAGSSLAGTGLLVFGFGIEALLRWRNLLGGVLLAAGVCFVSR